MADGDKEYWEKALRKKRTKRYLQQQPRKRRGNKDLEPKKHVTRPRWEPEPEVIHDRKGFLIYCLGPKPRNAWKFAGKGAIVSTEDEAVIFSSPDAAQEAILKSQHRYPRWAFRVIEA